MTEVWKRLKTAAFIDRDFLDTECYVVTKQPTPTLDGDDTVMIVTTTGQCESQKGKFI